MTTNNTTEPIEVLRAARADAERRRQCLIGELLEELWRRPDRNSNTVHAILEKIDNARADAEEAIAGIGRELERRAAGGDESAAARWERAHLNALVAYYVDGLELVANPVPGPYRWLVVDPVSRKHKTVANYAGDHAAARRALDQIAPEMLFGVSDWLTHYGANPEHPVLMASAADLCRAMLHTLDVPTDSTPPTIA